MVQKAAVRRRSLTYFSGGALEQCAVFSLGVMPYISASIMMQLLTAVVPQLGKLAKEEGGRQKVSQYTRYVTIVLCMFPGIADDEAVCQSVGFNSCQVLRETMSRLRTTGAGGRVLV